MIVLRNTLSEVQATPEGSAIRQKVIEAEQIISGLVNQSKNADSMAIGASAVTQKTRALICFT